MALDHPEKVKKFASFDILPTHHVLTHASWQWALGSFHWFFMAQPFDIPERLIQGREDFYILKKLTAMGIGKGGFSKETLAEYARCCTPENIHGVCEDYRAGATIDFEMDKKDLETGHRIACPWTRRISRPAARWNAPPPSSGARRATPRSTSMLGGPGRSTAPI
jgi:haloacetate dehalogenase